MAVGDVLVYNEARGYLIDGGWEPADDIKVALVTNTPAPAVDDTTPTLTELTEVSQVGGYTTGGISIGDLGTITGDGVGGTMTWDSATNPSWAQNGASPQDARWGIIYHVSSDLCIAFVDLGAVIDMQAGDLTITWDALGIFTIT